MKTKTIKCIDDLENTLNNLEYSFYYGITSSKDKIKIWCD